MSSHIWFVLIASAKFLGREGSIKSFSPMGYCLTISETFYSPDYPVYEGNEELRWVWDNTFLFYHLLWIKFMNSDENSGMRGEKYRLKSQRLGGDWNVSRATLCEFDITFLVQWNSRSHYISAAWWLAWQGSTGKILVRFPGGQNLNPVYLLK